MKTDKYIYISFILALLIGCENAAQKVAETTSQSIQNASTPAGTVGTIIYKPKTDINTTIISFSKNIMPIFETSCKSCHGTNPLQITGKENNRFSITTNSDTVTNITTNSLVNVGTPALSRLLKKATNVLTHYGNKKFDLNSNNYNTIYSWIKSGANNN